MSSGKARLAVDVIIPTYNRADVIERAIDSVLSQTVPVEKIIVVDDGSKDNTEKVVARYGNRITFLRQANAGASAARNTGIAQATADWVAFLDSDDYWLPTKLERQMEELARDPSAVLAYTGRVEAWSDGRVSSQEALDGSSVWPVLRVRNMVPTSGALVRRDVITELGGFDESISRAEDWDMWFRVHTRGSFVAAREPLTVISESSNSLSANVDRMVECTRRVADKSLLTGLSGLRREVWRRRIVSAELYRSFITLRESRAQDALDYLRRSLLLWPSPLFIPKRYASLVLALRPGPTR